MEKASTISLKDGEWRAYKMRLKILGVLGKNKNLLRVQISAICSHLSGSLQIAMMQAREIQSYYPKIWEID